MICPSANACRRRRSRSRCAPSRNSLSSTSTWGRNGAAPLRSRATLAPSHTTDILAFGPGASAKAASGSASSRATRRGISSRSARLAARSTSLRSSPSVCGSGTKAKPSIRPTGWPSTTTSPCRVTADSNSSAAPASRRRIRWAARRSTKRAVRRSCSASDSLSSTSRASACQCGASGTQSARAAM